MPVVAIVLTTSTNAYSASCADCKDWHQTFHLKRNADNAMIGHRILKHSYRALQQRQYDQARRINGRTNKVHVPDSSAQST